MPSLEQEYLEYISKKILPGNVRTDTYYWTLIGRFTPNNHTLSNIVVVQGLVAQKVLDRKSDENPTEYGDRLDKFTEGFNQNIKEVIKKIHHAFLNELFQDGITEQQLGLGEKGKPGRKQSTTQGPWQIVYEWLWNVKYSRWLQDHIWENWKQQAQTQQSLENADWIQFCDFSEPASRGMDLSRGMDTPKPLPKERIPLRTALSLKTNLDYSESYLLLFNRGQDEQGNVTKNLVAPSQAFAPTYQLTKKSMTIPLANAVMPYISFNATGTEEYIGIIINRALDLPWLKPDPYNPVLEWQGKHLEQIWKQLYNQDNWQIFYRDFNVI
jgi:hypothetical protein